MFYDSYAKLCICRVKCLNKEKQIYLYTLYQIVVTISLNFETF